MSNLSSGGLSRVLTYLKTWITGLLNSKSDTSHTHTKSAITDFPAYGSTAGTICQGNDSRLSDARTPNFANNTWYAVGDDVAIGDHNIGGGLGICGLNATTRIDFCQYNNAGNYKSITFDGTTLYMNGNCDYATSAGSANSAGYVQGDKSTGLYVNSVKYGNALVTTNQAGFGAIFNAPTKNNRIGCATYPNSDDNLIFYSVTNANVSSSTNNTNQMMTWNSSTGILSATGFSGPLTGNVTGNCSGSCNYANSAGSAGKADYLGDIGSTDRNGASGTGWYSVGFSYSYDEGHNELAINNYWGIRLNCRDSAHVTINGSRINVENATYLNGYQVYVG